MKEWSKPTNLTPTPCGEDLAGGVCHYMRGSAASGIGLLLGIVAVSLVIACGVQQTVAPPDSPPNFGVSGISVSPQSATLHVGDTLRLRGIATYGTAQTPRDTTIMWVSSRPAVARIDSLSGLVTASAPGTATMTATLRVDNNFKAGAQVTVIP